jgi:uncharacterized repeat protein (TIGR03803 family)
MKTAGTITIRMHTKRSGIKAFCIGVVALLWLTAIASLPARAQGTYSLIHTFTSVPDGAYPNAVIQDAQGILYGTTYAGGNHCSTASCGTIYKIDSSGNETVLFRFTGGTEGGFPKAALVEDFKGNLYGNTQGNGYVAYSVAFKLDTKGNYTVLYDFDTVGGHGCCQDSPLAIGKDGILYGMSPYDGQENCGYQGLGCGLLYKLTQSGVNTVIHVFKNSDGNQPEGGLVVDSDGSLYGTAIIGGDMSCSSIEGYNLGCGTIYKLDPKGNFTVLHTFTGKEDGGAPLGLIQDSRGNLYGIALSGGNSCINTRFGCGTIFKVDTAGKFSVIYRFTNAIKFPYFQSHLVIDSNGNLYGSNGYGGKEGRGFIFRVTTNREFSIIASYPSNTNRKWGTVPQGIVRDSAGNFYGTMQQGGADGVGTVFKVIP